MPESCRSCGEKIMFVETKSGNVMPVNFKPDPTGSLVMREEEGRRVVQGVTPIPNGQLSLLEERRYKSHFATCPDRDVWRNRRGRMELDE